MRRIKEQAGDRPGRPAAVLNTARGTGAAATLCYMICLCSMFQEYQDSYLSLLEFCPLLLLPPKLTGH